MPDLVEWLRGHKIQRYHEAAEEIERLRHEIKLAYTLIDKMDDERSELLDEIEQLNAPPV